MLQHFCSLTADGATLKRVFYNGETQDVPAVSNDYAATIAAFLDLHEISDDPVWLETALSLQKTLDVQFWDAQDGGYFTAASDSLDASFFRLKEDFDGAEPCVASLAAENSRRLWKCTGDEKWKAHMEDILVSVSLILTQAGLALPGAVTVCSKLL